MPTTAEERSTIRARLIRDEEAERRAAARVRLDADDRRAKLAEMDDFIAEGRRKEIADLEAGRQEMRDRRDRLDALALPPATISPAQMAADLKQAGAIVGQWEREERDAALKSVLADEDRKVYEPGFRSAFERIHRGGTDRCTCAGHRLLRREI